MNRIKLFCTVLAVLVPVTVGAQECSVSAKACAFGDYDVYSDAPADGTGTVSVTCTPAAIPVVISIDAGLNSGGSFTPRKMKSGTAGLTYNLYLDSARVQVWGDGTGSTHTRPTTTGTDITVFGRIPPGQQVGPGSYKDRVTITVTW